MNINTAVFKGLPKHRLLPLMPAAPVCCVTTPGQARPLDSIHPLTAYTHSTLARKQVTPVLSRPSFCLSPTLLVESISGHNAPHHRTLTSHHSCYLHTVCPSVHTAIIHTYPVSEGAAQVPMAPPLRSIVCHLSLLHLSRTHCSLVWFSC